jgi:hypothetical protein
MKPDTNIFNATHALEQFTVNDVNIYKTSLITLAAGHSAIKPCHVHFQKDAILFVIVRPVPPSLMFLVLREINPTQVVYDVMAYF